MISGAHPTADEIARYQARDLPPDELIAVAHHIQRCDRCQAAVGAGTPERIVTLPPASEDHLSYDEMERWVDGDADAAERELVETHISHCTICRDELADLERSRDTLRDLQPRRAWKSVAAAAIAVVAIAAAAVLLTRRPAATPQSRALRMPDIVAALNPAASPQRGEQSPRQTFMVLQPVGTVVLDSQPKLFWSTVDHASSYTVVIADLETGALAATGSTTSTEWSPPMPLQQGRTYSWQVKARRARETVVEPQPPYPEALFRVASAAEAAAWRDAMKGNHVAAGIALAQHGFLDDAERELQLAADSGDAPARDLLTQVRSWRATPIATRP